MKTLPFTGERMVPSKNKTLSLYYEHLMRYLFVSEYVSGKRVLDLGSGSGYGSNILVQNGALSVIGTDNSQDAISYSKKLYQSRRLKFIRGDVLDLSFLKNKYDIVVAFEIIEHLQKQDEFLKQVKLKIKRDGLFFISTPNVINYPEGNPYHKKELSYKEFKSILRKYFKNVYVLGQYFVMSSILNAGNKSVEKLSIENEKYSKDLAKHYKLILDDKNAQFFVAICSNRTIDDMKMVNLSTDTVDLIDFSLGTQRVNKQIQKLASQEQQIVNLNRELAEIRSSKFFKVWQAYCKFRDSLRTNITKKLK